MSDDLEVVSREQVGRKTWDAFVDASSEAWLWHRYDLCEALGMWESSTDASFALRADGRLLAVFPLRLIAYRRLRLLSVHDAESLGGPAVAPDLGRRLARRAREVATGAALERGFGRIVELRVALPTLSPAWRGPESPRVNPLLALGFANDLTQTWVVDLRQGPNALWDGMEGRTRTAVRKAQREGITIRPARTTQNDLDTYVRLHMATCARTGARPHPRPYFEAIWTRFLPQGVARILFAERDGDVIAARNYGVYKGGALTWTAAGIDDAGPLGANALLQWEAMRAFAEDGVECSDTGESFPGARDRKLRGLSEFKRSFGGELVPFYRGRMDFRSRIMRLLDALRN